MPSPFPGMDPYLEDPAFWADFHARFITYWCDILADRLPGNYEARIDEKVNLVETVVPHKRLIEPDVALLRSGNGRSAVAAPASAAVALMEPVTVSMVIEEETHARHIEILHRPDRKLVAVLELLSPANKVEPGRTLYVGRRNSLILHAVHLVELDLLLKGSRLRHVEDLPAGDYYAFIARAERRPKCDVYAWTIQQPLPTIPIPLLAPDPDIPFDLGALFATTYERGRYARSLNYMAAPAMPLEPASKAWVMECARQVTET